MLVEECTHREDIASWIRRNDLALLLKELTNDFQGLDTVGELEELAWEAWSRAESMATLIEATTKTFEKHGISYTIFKTFNRAMRIDVDVDILIPRDKYGEAVQALLDHGFKPIDSLSKTYATGFMLPQNPIILDLHTQITVLGTPYYNPQPLLQHREKKRIRLGGKNIEAYTPQPIPEAAVRIAHAVIKEAEIRIDDVTETLNTIHNHKKQLEKHLQQQNLTKTYQTYLNNLAQITIDNLQALPAKIPEKQRLQALLDKLRKDRRTTSLITSLTNTRYKRNAAMLGKTALYILGKAV